MFARIVSLIYLWLLKSVKRHSDHIDGSLVVLINQLSSFIVVIC